MCGSFETVQGDGGTRTRTRTSVKRPVEVGFALFCSPGTFRYTSAVAR